MARKRGNSIEEICVNRIEAGIRDLEKGLKKPEEIDLTFMFERLDTLNKDLSDELFIKYFTLKQRSVT
jgi:hypothetical protein